MKTLIALIVMVVFSQLLFSQNDSVYNFMIPSFKLHQNENGKKVYYEFEKEWNLVTVKDSFLLADPNKYSYKVNLQDITKISFHSGSNPEKTALITGFVGFCLGFLASGQKIDFGGGSSDYSFGRAVLGGCLGALLFGLIGGSVAMIVGSDDYYNFHDNNLLAKKQKIINILKKNRIKK